MSSLERTAGEWRIGPEDWEAAVAETDGPQLVVAGPGAGKTEFLVRRAVHLIESGVAPGSVLLLTFSRRGAAELRSRIEAGLDRSSTVVSASTFHSLCHRLLETYGGEAFGWTEVPALLTGPEQVELVRDLLSRESGVTWPLSFRGLLGSRTFAEEVADFLLRAQEHLLDPEGLAERAASRSDWRALPRFLGLYLDELERRGRLDYGSLQTRTVELLREAGTRRAVAEQYRYVLADEYQDTTVAQAALLEHLSSEHRNLTAAADPYQSVYSFRGAELHNVADFPERFPDRDGRPARRVVLTTSFRVPGPILGAAERLTEATVLPGAAGPVTPAPHGGRVEAFLFDQQSHEAEWIASEVQRLHLEERIPYPAMAVLVRTKRRILSELSRALERRDIPHDSPATRLADRPAVRMVLDCVAAAVDAPDRPGAEEAIRRLLLGPLFGLPLGTVRDLRRTRRRDGVPWAGLLGSLVPGGEALAGLLEDPSWAGDRPAVDGFWHLWTTLPQLAPLVQDPERTGLRSAWSSLAQALARQAERDPAVTLEDYLHRAEHEEFEAQPLLSHRDDRTDRLVLTTLHQAKGLEFEVVFVADAVEGVFPDLRSRGSLLRPRLLSPTQSADPAAFARFRLQEETRLAYTAMTRARRRVVWTATTAGLDEDGGGVSRFLPLAAGVDSLEELSAPVVPGVPVTPLEAEAHLRRLLRDPAESPARRLAAAAVLAGGPDLGLRHPRSFAGVLRRGSDAGLVDREMTLSPSQADAYSMCPRRYALERRIKVAPEPGAHAVLGGVVHRVLEETERAAARDGRPHGTLAEALDHLESEWDPDPFGGGAWARSWRRRAEELLTRLYTHWPTAGSPIALEHRLDLELDGMRWTGRADRVERDPDGTVRVVDYKTGKRPAAKEEAAASLQLGFYLLAVGRDPDLAEHGPPSEAQFWYPAHETTSGKVTTRSFDARALEEVAGRLGEIARRILEEDWVPAPGDHCRHCSVRESCPAWPEGREAFVR